MKELKINSIDDLKNEGKSFYWASFFLPKRSRVNAGILYSICRYFDNIADQDIIDRSTLLKESLETIRHDKNHTVNFFLKDNNINISILEDLIKGLIADQKKVRIKNETELINYSYHVAGTVGLMMSKIIGVETKKANSYAIDLGIAMQLTNIVRDVYDDAKLQRIYIPIDLIPNISMETLNGQKTINNEQEKIIGDAIYKIIDLSEKFYSNGFVGLKYIPINTRLAIFIAANVYKEIGKKIKKNGKKYLRKRVYVTKLEKILITFKSLLLFFFIPLINYQYLNIRDTLPNENL